MSNFFDIKGKHLLAKCPPDVDEEEWKLFREDFAERDKHLAEKSAPIQLDVELNGGCNMACPFCLHGYGTRIPNIQLSMDAYKHIIQEAVAIGVKSLKLNYINEPMLRKDLEEAIRYARDQGIINIYMVTNGTVLNEKRRISLLASGITKVFISIDAVTPETYNKQRLSGKYNLVVQNIMDFIKLRNDNGLEFPLVRVSFLKNAINIHEEKEFRKKWEGVADIINFQTMNEIPDMETGLLVEESPEPEKGCSFPFKQLVVDHLGNIQPCCKLAGKKLIIGNIKDMTLEQAWNHEQSVALRQAHKTDEWKKHPVCYDCMCPNAKPKENEESSVSR